MADRGITWTFEETKALLALWGDENVQRELAVVRRNKPIWEKIAASMVENGFDRTLEQCRTRINNLVQEYKRLAARKDESFLLRKKKFVFYDDIDRTLGDKRFAYNIYNSNFNNLYPGSASHSSSSSAENSFNNSNAKHDIEVELESEPEEVDVAAEFESNGLKEPNVVPKETEEVHRKLPEKVVENNEVLPAAVPLLHLQTDAIVNSVPSTSNDGASTSGLNNHTTASIICNSLNRDRALNPEIEEINVTSGPSSPLNCRVADKSEEIDNNEPPAKKFKSQDTEPKKQPVEVKEALGEILEHLRRESRAMEELIQLERDRMKMELQLEERRRKEQMECEERQQKMFTDAIVTMNQQMMTFLYALHSSSRKNNASHNPDNFLEDGEF